VRLRFAEEEARRLGAAYVGTEHVLLGLMRDPEGVGARVLRKLGISLERVHSAVRLMITASPVGVVGRSA